MSTACARTACLCLSLTWVQLVPREDEHFGCLASGAADLWMSTTGASLRERLISLLCGEFAVGGRCVSCFCRLGGGAFLRSSLLSSFADFFFSLPSARPFTSFSWVPTASWAFEKKLSFAALTSTEFLSATASNARFLDCLESGDSAKPVKSTSMLFRLLALVGMCVVMLSLLVADPEATLLDAASTGRSVAAEARRSWWMRIS